MSGGGPKTRHGRCTQCKVAYSWDNAPLLRDARCPTCGMDLRKCKLLSVGKHLFERPTDAQPVREAAHG